MNTWIFQGNPNYFDIDSYIIENSEIWWSVKQVHFVQEIKIGDRVFLWRSDGGIRESGGIVALGEIIKEPVIRTDEDAKEYWHTDGWSHPGYGVQIRILEVDLNNSYVKRTTLLNNEDLSDLLILRMASSTNYKIEKRHSDILYSLWSKSKPNWKIVKECAYEYVEKFGEPFKKIDLVNYVLSEYPDRNENSIRPVIQGLTVNATGGAPSAIGKNVLRRIGHNEYVLNINKFPIIRDSWTVYSDCIFVKLMDKSTFLHNGTGIPKDMTKFWDADTINRGGAKHIQVKYKNDIYEMKLECESYELARVRLFWKSDFSKIISIKYQSIYDALTKNEPYTNYPKMRFVKAGSIDYTVEFVDDASVENDTTIDDEEMDISISNKEGKQKTYFGKRYERDPKNRKLAIEYHGTTCLACGFNFEEYYGDHGEGYIEIHHIKPLYIDGIEIEVNPYTDLIPLCSNCHRMVHRNKDKVLDLKELQQILMINKR